MIDGGIRQGVPREFILDGMNLDPAEGATPTIRLSGRSGATHLSGNGTMYGESNPHPGYLSQDVSCTMEQFKRLSDLQSSGRFVGVTFTTAGNEILDGKMRIANDGAIENVNGICSIELAGELRKR